MEYAPLDAHLLNDQALHIPNLVCEWNFNQSGKLFTASSGESYQLESQTGDLSIIDVPEAGGDGKAIAIAEGDWLRIPRSACPRLDFHGTAGQFTVLSRILRKKKSHPQCEFIAGQWNETNLGRQYGMFLNISVWGVTDRLYGHLSHTGGPTPGYRYCMDGPMGESTMTYDCWRTIGMSFDGLNGRVWHNGLLDGHTSLNPYAIAGGLHNGGPNGSDFTVGAVDRSGEMGNFFHGAISQLAIYDRALTPAEIYAWHTSAAQPLSDNE